MWQVGYLTLTVGPCQKYNFTAVFQFTLQCPKNNARQQVHWLYLRISFLLNKQAGSITPYRFFPLNAFSSSLDLYFVISIPPLTGASAAAHRWH